MSTMSVDSVGNSLFVNYSESLNTAQYLAVLGILHLHLGQLFAISQGAKDKLKINLRSGRFPFPSLGKQNQRLLTSNQLPALGLPQQHIFAVLALPGDTGRGMAHRLAHDRRVLALLHGDICRRLLVDYVRGD